MIISIEELGAARMSLAGKRGKHTNLNMAARRAMTNDDLLWKRNGSNASCGGR